MIEGLKPYAEYKESGQPWLGTIPKHWDVRRAKLILREVDSRSTTGMEQLLRVSQYTGVTQRKAADGSDGPDTRAASLIGYKRVSVNDLVINIMLAWNGSMGASCFDGIASPAYCVYRFNKGAQPWYFHQLFRLPLYKGRIKAVSTGVIESRLRLYSDDLGRIETLLPPPADQAAIVRFLDHANRKIDGFIRAKRKLIGLLNEQKQAIIHNAVTRGLNPDVALKPSGIPWLGEIPGHWKILRSKYVFREMDERSKTGNEEQLSVSHITGVTPRSQKNITMFKAESYVGHKICFPGDLAVNTMWAWMAALGISKHEGIISPAYAVYRQRKPEHLLSDYADHLLRIAPYKLNYLSRSTGLRASRLRLYPDEFLKISIIIPPKVEQQQIIDSIYVDTSALTTAISRTEREIALMQEYRTRLTADIVTGKLDVREAAAKLPEVPSDGGGQADASEMSDLSGDLDESTEEEP
jgi:type I restriction enzyme S subunit